MEGGLSQNWFERHMEQDQMLFFPYTVHLAEVQMTQRSKFKK